jgi:hypothetical protein
MKIYKSMMSAALLACFLCFWGMSAISRKELPLRIQTEEVLSIGSLDDDILFQWVGIDTDDQSNIYVTDSMDHSLKKFSPSGELVAQAGRKGQGPGEFEAPRQLVHFRGRLYVTDQAFAGLKVFDEDLRFVNSLRLEFPVSDIQESPDGRVAVFSFLMGRISELCFLTQNGVVDNRLKLGRERTNVLMDSADFAFDRSGNIYVVNSFRDLIRKLNSDGREIWSKSLFNIKNIKKMKVERWIVPTEIIYKDCAVDSRGWLYILGGHRAENRARDIYVLDHKGKWLSTFTLPDTSHCIHLDGEDFLYARANDGLTLKKYRLRHEWRKK